MVDKYVSVTLRGVIKTPGSNTSQEMKEKYHQATEVKCLEITQVHFFQESQSVRKDIKNLGSCGICSWEIYEFISWIDLISETETPGALHYNVFPFCNVLTNHSDSVRESLQFSHTFPGVSFLQVAPYFGGPLWEKGYAGSVSSALSLAFGVIGAHGQCVNSIRCRNRIRISNLCPEDGHVNIMILAHPVFALNFKGGIVS